MKMDKRSKHIPQKQVTPVTSENKENPNVLVYNFLKANNLRIKLEAVEPDGGFVGNGFLLMDKAILKVVFERI